MTVNERLFEAGLLSDWDSVVAARNIPAIVEVLGRAHLSEESESIIAAVLHSEEGLQPGPENRLGKFHNLS